MIQFDLSNYFVQKLFHSAVAVAKDRAMLARRGLSQGKKTDKEK